MSSFISWSKYSFKRICWISYGVCLPKSSQFGFAEVCCAIFSYCPKVGSNSALNHDSASSAVSSLISKANSAIVNSLKWWFFLIHLIRNLNAQLPLFSFCGRVWSQKLFNDFCSFNLNIVIHDEWVIKPRSCFSIQQEPSFARMPREFSDYKK